MTSAFAMNSTMDKTTLSAMSPQELEEAIKTYNSTAKPAIDESKREMELEATAATFWVDTTHDPYGPDGIYPHIHHSTEALAIKQLLASHSRFLILAGAGMSAGSLPTFRGAGGKTLMGPGSSLTGDILRTTFDSASPPSAYSDLLQWVTSNGRDYRVATTNIDGYFAA